MTISETVFMPLDTETTRKDPADPEQEVIEVCAVQIDARGFQTAAAPFERLIFAQHPIPPESSGIHHLTDGDLIGQPSRDQVDDGLVDFITLAGSVPVPVAHHAQFDKAVLGNERNGLLILEWLCTQRMAQHLVPDAPNYKLGTLFYLFGGITPKKGAAHRSAFDVAMLIHVFLDLLERYRAFARKTCAGDAERLAQSEQIERLLAFVNRPIVMTKFPAFGKHAGAPWAAIPLDYLYWCLSPRGLTNMDADLRWNIESRVAQREGRML